MRGLIKVLLMIITCIITTLLVRVNCEPQVPCYFIFGDSLSDVGNNNELITQAKANYPPYGIDFPGGIPTGRFSNGRNFVDRITELLGFDEYIPPFSTAKGPEILKGVNYASGAAGIRSETGQHLGARISMDQQLQNHLVTIGKLAGMVKGGLLENLGKCLYTVNMGSNDYINNYFMPQFYISSLLFSPEQYTQALIDQYTGQLKTLYWYGARKVAVFGVGLIGCTLAEIATLGTDGSLCVDKVNAAASLFNQKLIKAVDELNTNPNLRGAQFTYIGSSTSTDTGSSVSNASCCKVRTSDYQCQEYIAPCPDRNNYIFWDGFHTTEVVYVATGESAYNSVDPSLVHPVDIKTLVALSNNQALMKIKATSEGYKYSS